MTERQLGGEAKIRGDARLNEMSLDTSLLGGEPVVASGE